MNPTILRETCVCGAETAAAIATRGYQSDANAAHKALAEWRRDHRHEKPARQVVRIPLAGRRA